VVECGTGSWGLIQSVEVLLHVALYTRAVLALPTAAGTPPPLRGGPAPIPALSPGNSAAAAAWQEWWDDQIARIALVCGADRATPAPPERARTPGPVGRTPAVRVQDRDRWAGWTHWRDGSPTAPPVPPTTTGWTRCSARPSSPPRPRRTPGPPCTPAADTWTTLHARGLRPEHTELGLWVAADAAAAVAFEHDIPLTEIRGLPLPLAVTGTWWQQWAPGIVLCSLDALTHPPTAYTIAYTTLVGPHRT